MSFATKKNDTFIKYISYCVMLASFFIFIVTMIVSHGESATQLFFSNKTDTGMDFYNSIYSAGTYKPYQRGDVYPPLAELFFVICSRFCPASIWEGDADIRFGGSEVRFTQGGQIAFMFFLIISVSILLASVKKITEKTKDFQLIFFCFLISMPFLYCVERGNILLLAFSCTVFFIAYYDDESMAKREGALLMLAFASALKLYPAIFVLLLFHEKKVFPVLRTGLYTVALSLLPLIFLGRGLFDFIQNSAMFAGNGMGITLNISGAFAAIEIMTGAKLYEADFIISIILFTIVLLLSFFVKEKWKRVLFLSLALLNGYTNSYIYVGVFLLVPWVFFIITEKNESRIDKAVYTVLFLIILAPLPMGQVEDLFSYNTKWEDLGFNPENNKCLLSAIAVGTMSIYAVFDAIMSIILNKRKD